MIVFKSIPLSPNQSLIERRHYLPREKNNKRSKIKESANQIVLMRESIIRL